MGTVRIVLADDHQAVRDTVRSFLGHRTRWEIVGEAANGHEAVTMVERLRPHILLMDVSMPGLDGHEVVERVAACAPETQILVLSMHDSERLVHELLDAGAHAYVIKSQAPERLIPAIQELVRGRAARPRADELSP